MNLLSWAGSNRESVDNPTHGEPWLPLVTTLLVATVIPLLLPDALLPGPRWIFPVLIFALIPLVGSLVVNSAGELLRTGALVWLA